MLATQEDVRDALRRDLTENEELWVDSLIAEAGDLVEGYLHPFTVPTVVPDPIKRVVAAMVAAVLNRPSGILPETQSLTADSYGVQFTAGSTSPGPYLTDGFKRRLRPFKLDSVVMGLVSEHDRGSSALPDVTGVSPNRVIVITRDTDRVITVRRRNSSGTVIDWNAQVYMRIDRDRLTPTQVNATVDGPVATIRLESTLLDAVRDGTAWRVIMSQSGSPSLESAVMVGTFKRNDG
jgi:hypothetical protein